MNDKLWIAKVWPFTLSDAYGIADALIDRCLSASVVLSKEGEKKQWGIEIINDSPIAKEMYDELAQTENFSCAELPDMDWLAVCFANFRPITIEDFYIYGSHTKLPKNVGNKICIQIDAASAFGSGEHQTTKGCLKALRMYFNPRQHKSAMDLGCGSCILSIALAKLGCKKIFAFDNDPEAIRVSQHNIEKNKVSNNVQIIQNSSDEFKIRKYDLIVSNILATPLILLSKSIAHCLSDNGVLIISGFTEEQTDVIKCYEKLGLQKLYEINMDTWLTAVLKKKK